MFANINKCMVGGQVRASFGGINFDRVTANAERCNDIIDPSECKACDKWAVLNRTQIETYQR